MLNISLNSKENRNGKVVYNTSIVHNIVALAIAEVEGVLPIEKKNGISLRLERDGIYVFVAVAVKWGFNVPELAYKIQQSVKQSVENMTKYKVQEVDVHIDDVAFVAPITVEKEPEEEQTEN